MKIIQGPAEKDLIEVLEYKFKNVQRLKPNASRAQSREMYLWNKGFQQSENEYFILKTQLEQRWNYIQEQGTSEEREKFIEELKRNSALEMEEIAKIYHQRGEEIPLDQFDEDFINQSS